MGILALVLIILAVLLIIPGIFVAAVKFLLWVGIILAVIALIVWLVDYLRGRSRV